MSVLKFGVPNSESLRCDHPVCNELATHLLLIGPKKEGAIERFACNDHAAQMQIGLAITGVERLKKAGERNQPKE